MLGFERAECRARIGYGLVRLRQLIACSKLLGKKSRGTRLLLPCELKGWVVPRDAVLSDAQGEYLFQVAGSKAVRVRVKRIGGDDNNSVVEGALDPARPLVTLGNYQLNDGGAVRLSAAAARTPGS